MQLSRQGQGGKVLKRPTKFPLPPLPTLDGECSMLCIMLARSAVVSIVYVEVHGERCMVRKARKEALNGESSIPLKRPLRLRRPVRQA